MKTNGDIYPNVVLCLTDRIGILYYVIVSKVVTDRRMM